MRHHARPFDAPLNFKGLHLVIFRSADGETRVMAYHYRDFITEVLGSVPISEKVNQ